MLAMAPTITCSGFLADFLLLLPTLLLSYHSQNKLYGDNFLTCGLRLSPDISEKAIMGEIGLDSKATASLQPPLDDRLLLKWLEDQSEEFQSK